MGVLRIRLGSQARRLRAGNPGTIHTLHLFENTEIVFTVDGSIEFLNEDDTLNYTLDMWSVVHLYEEFCKANGLQLNERIFY